MNSIALLVAVGALCALSSVAPASRLEDYDVIWTTPSEDAAGSMPIGNGEVVLNAWVESGTGDLMIYIARSDALSEICRILKLGAVRIHFSPNTFLGGSNFRQHLRLREGIIEFTGDGGTVQLFVDSHANVIHLAGEFSQPKTVTATVEDWRTGPRQLSGEEGHSAWSVHDAPFPLVESADHFETAGGSVRWYHRNESSIVPQLLENQSLTGVKGAFDPLLHRTFGAKMEGAGFATQSDHSIATATPLSHLDLRIATASAQTNTVEEWKHLVDLEARRSPLKSSLARTRLWWNDFWNRSWVLVTGGEKSQLVTRGYFLQRYVQACQGRGTYPIKFNGGLYTVEPKKMGKPFNADFRQWGDSYWYQNTRHMYFPMLAAGDFDMMEPFFKMYESVRPIAESRTEKYHGVKGAYFPETMTVFGTYSGGDYGWNRKGLQPKDVQCPWWQYAWNQGPEYVALMLDRWDYTRDEAFLKNRVLPMANSILEYFDTRFKKDNQGRIILDPTQVIETFWQGVINDMPSTAGLIAITHRLCALPKGLVPSAQRAFFERMRSACPELPLKQSSTGERELSSAQEYIDKPTNTENGELYAVWPFQVVSLGYPELLAEAKKAYADRKYKLDVGWGYDGNVAALLGMTDEAKRILVKKCENSHAGYRWPATWGPNYDWLPDQNHGGNLLETSNLMLLQGESMESGGAIRLLPAWPKEWDVDFKLRAPGNTVVHCVTKGGAIVKLDVTPAPRAKDIVLAGGWAKAPTLAP